MRSFRDRNPYLIGIGSIAIIAVLVTLAFMAGYLHLLEKAYPVRAVFSDASGIRVGDDVRVAGVKVGRVTDVKADRRHGHVVVGLKIRNGVELGARPHAAIALETLLGTKFVRLSGPVGAPYLADLPAARRLIPIDRTSTPFDVFELTKVGTRAVQATDTAKLNQLIGQLADVSEGKQAQIAQLVDGLAKLSTAVNDREAQLRSLFDRSAQLSSTLAEKDQTLVGLIDQSRDVLDIVERHQAEVSRGLRGGAAVATQLSGIVAAHKTQLDLLLETLHPTIDILDRHQAELDKTLAWIGSGTLGLARAAAHGPWQDIYVRAVGPDVIKVLEGLRQP